MTRRAAWRFIAHEVQLLWYKDLVKGVAQP